MKNKLNFSYFSGSALYAFVRALQKIANSTILTEGILNTLLVKLEAILSDFSKGFEFDATDPHTIEAREKDDVRDACYTGMKEYVASFLKHPLAAKVQAAKTLVAVIRKYGWSAEKFGYDEETTAIVKCIEEMTTKCSAEVAEISVQDLWITPLTEAQEAFEIVQNKRIANGAVDMPTISKYRKPMEGAIRSFVDMLAIFAENSTDETIIGYASEIDELIGRTMATLKASDSRSDNQQEDAGEENSMDDDEQTTE